MSGFRLLFPDGSLESFLDDGTFVLTAGAMRAEFAGALLGDFPENAGLPSRPRVHETHDTLSAGAETDTVLPFGSEYEIHRRFECADGFCKMALNINPGAGAVKSLDFDPVSFRGDWKHLGIVRMPVREGVPTWEWIRLDEERQVLYEDARPFAAVVLEDASGARLELGCGGNLWRHAAPGTMEGSCSAFKLEGNRQEVKLERRMFAFDDEHLPLHRQWLFESYCAWSMPDWEISGTEPEFGWDKSIGPEGRNGEGDLCLCSNSARRRLREALRKVCSGRKFGGVEIHNCFNASHCGRPQREQLPHWDAADWIELTLWANRTLRKEGHSFQALPERDGFLSQGALGKALAHTLRDGLHCSFVS